MTGDDRDERLHDLVVGDDDPASEASLDRRDRRALSQYRGIQRALDRASDSEREQLDDLDPPDPGDLDLVKGVLDPLARAPAPRSSSTVRYLTAAAGLILAVTIFAVVNKRDDPGGRETYMGNSGGRMSPAGEVDGPYSPFSWTIDAPPAGKARVQVLSENGEVVLESPELSAQEWTIDAETDRGLPDRILWRVRLFDSSGVFADSFDEWAWRSSS